MEIYIPAGKTTLTGNLHIPTKAQGIVLFAHGSGSSRLSPRNQFVAKHLEQAGLATLLIDLLDEQEGREDERTRALRFNIPHLAERLHQITSWLSKEHKQLKIGCFGASTGAAAALVAAAIKGCPVKAIVSRGGRPDLAGVALSKVSVPTLLIVGGDDTEVIALNREALAQLHCEKKLVIVPRATHLFEEPGALEQVATLARDWFLKYLS